MSYLRDYAQNMVQLYERAQMEIDEYGLPYKLLVEHGEDATWSPLPDGEEYGFAKQCYANAANRVLLGEPGLTYYEGLATAAMTIPHAWAQDADGRVYDVTLRHNDPRCPYCNGDKVIHPTQHWDYHGHDEENDDDPCNDDAAEVPCEMCDATGKVEPVSREGVAYLGIPIPTDVLGEAILEHGVYGVLFNDPERVANLLTKEKA